jgi:hypothetical protein
MRRPHDAYYTPASACDVLKRHWDGWRDKDYDRVILIDPCCGDGAFQRAWPDSAWRTIDIDPAVKPHRVIDMSRFAAWRHARELGAPFGNMNRHAVVMNPPFKHSLVFVQGAFRYFGKVAALLRLSFLEPTRQRGPWLERYPPDLIIVLPRISFTGDGKTDSVTCAWMIWDSEIKNRGVIVSPRLAPQSARSQVKPT